MPASYTFTPAGLPSYKGPDWTVPNLADASAYGSRPSAPSIISTAPQATSGAIATGNLAFGQLPGYQQSLANVGGNIQALTAGQVPQDVQNRIATAAAERGVATGSPGSPNANASYLQSLGLTSLGLEQQGQQALNAQTAALPGAAISQNPNFYVSPEQQYNAALQGSIFAAAPDPAAAARAGMSAAAAGLGAGMGASQPLFPPSLPTITPANSSTATEMATGSGVDTGWNPALNTAAMSQSAVDQILQQYSPVTDGSTTQSVDQSTFYGGIPGMEDFYPPEEENTEG